MNSILTTGEKLLNKICHDVTQENKQHIFDSLIVNEIESLGVNKHWEIM